MKQIGLLLSSWMASVMLMAAPVINDATVTLPYAEIYSLLQRVTELEQPVEPIEAKAPVAVLVHSAEYRLESDAATLTAAFEVSNLSDVWQAVDLITATQAIRAIEPADAKVVQSDGMLRLLMSPGERSSVTLSLMTGAGERSRAGRTIAAFTAIPAARSRLSVTQVPELATMVVSGAVAESADHTEFGLPSAGGQVRIKLYEESAAEDARWHADSQTVVSEAQGGFLVRCQLRLNAADNGRTSAADVLLPRMANVVQVGSSGLRGPSATEMTDGGQRLRLQWDDDETTTREVYVEFTSPLPAAADEWEVPRIQILNTDSLQQAFYFGAFDGVALQPVGQVWDAVGRVPAWIQSEVGTEDLHYLEVRDGSGVQLQARLLPRLQTAEATVLLADYRTNLVVEGGMLHQATITIEHGARASYPFQLPVGGKLLTCEVAGRKANPLLLENGGLLLVLPSPTGRETQTKVSYSYTVKGAKLNPVEGKADLELPFTPLFIHQLKWSVQLPSVYQATALEGNVVIEAGGSAGQLVHLSKQLCDAERPEAALYYTRKDID